MLLAWQDCIKLVVFKLLSADARTMDLKEFYKDLIIINIGDFKENFLMNLSSKNNLIITIIQKHYCSKILDYLNLHECKDFPLKPHLGHFINFSALRP